MATKVLFPCDQDKWWLVKDGLHSLKQICMQENCDLHLLAEVHQTVVNTTLGLGDIGQVEWGQCVFYGLVKFLHKHATSDERAQFLQITLPAIIDLSLQIENLLPTEGIMLNVQQQGETREIDRQLCCSILACAFLCLFPNEDRGFRTKLNNINFGKFFACLPIPSQNAKLRCIIHFFDRVSAEWDRLTGKVAFTRQVIKPDELPSLDTWLNCNSGLCKVDVHQEGVIEDAGCNTIEVDFANRYIGGGVLGRGRVQEEIRFTVCPELIVSLLFMEVMEENEAIVIKGYEQFSSTLGYAASLKYAGDHVDPAVKDEDCTLRNTLCAIDAISYNSKHGDPGRQYLDTAVLRDINKAFTGFCIPFTIQRGISSISEEDYFTADDEDEHVNNTPDIGMLEMHRINVFVEDLLCRAISIALPEAANLNSHIVSDKRKVRRKQQQPTKSETEMDDSLNSQSSASTSTDDALPSQSLNSNEDLPMSHLDVNFRDWYTNFRRRSSNLSDLSSRRSSYDLSRRSSNCSNRGYSSEFSSEFEEYFDNFQTQDQKYKYHTITEEVGTSAVYEFAANLAANLLREGTREASHTESGVQDFHSEQPTDIQNKPHPVRVSETDLLPVCDHNDNNNNRNETVARQFVENMFNRLWPFDGSVTEERCVVNDNIVVVEDFSVQTCDKDEVRERILEECGGQLDIPDTLQNTDNETEDNDDDIDSVTAADTSVPEVVIDKDCNIVDENGLYDVADKMVSLAFQEALVEYRYKYVLNSSRTFEAQVSLDSSSSQSDHSMDCKKDQSEAVKQAQVSESNQSDLSNRSAVRVADRVMLELFHKESTGDTNQGNSDQNKSHKQCNIPKADNCDSKSHNTPIIISPHKQTHSSFHGNKAKQQQHDDKHLQMYSRIADKLLMGGFPKSTTDSKSDSNQSDLNFSHDSAVDQSQTRTKSCDQDFDQSQMSDLKFESLVLSSSPYACDSLSSQNINNSSNQHQNILDDNLTVSGPKPDTTLSRRGSERSKSSRISDKRSSSSSSEGKCAIAAGGNSFSINSSDGHENLSKNTSANESSSSQINQSNDNSSSPLNQSTESDKTGSESSIPKIIKTGSKKLSKVDDRDKQTNKPKVKADNKHQHHVVGNKKNYDQFANSLSRDLLTNAFLQVQEHSEHVQYPRRSSEPMQISNGPALQRLENSRQKVNGRTAHKSKTAEDISQFDDGWTPREPFCHRSSTGFRDPILSRFAEELMKANVSVPTLQLLSDCVSTSGSSRSVCSTISSFRDPLLATFEDELINTVSGKSFARTQMSWSKMKGSMCSPRQNDTRSSYNNNNNNSNGSQGNHSNHSCNHSNHSGNHSNHSGNHSNHSRRKQRMNSTSIESEISAISWKSYKSNSVVICSEEMSDFADSLSRRILCEALTMALCERLHKGGKSDKDFKNRSRMTLDMYGEMLARNILQVAIATAENQMVCCDWLEQNKIVTWSEQTECLEYSGDNTDSSHTDSEEERLASKSPESGSSSLEYEDALDIPYRQLEQFADVLASRVLINSVAISRRERLSTLRRHNGRPIATGNWGCGAFCGDPHLKSLLQWMAASYAGTPCMLYYTFNHPAMVRFQEVVDCILERGWNVSNLMQAVRRYCISAEYQIQQHGYVSHDLFDVIIQGELFPGIHSQRDQ